MHKKGQLTTFTILGVATLLFMLLIVMNVIQVGSVIQVKKTISLSTDLSDQGTSVLSILNDEYNDKKYIQILGESYAVNYATQPDDEIGSVRLTLSKMKDDFGFELLENSLYFERNDHPTSPEYGECGNPSKSINVPLTWPSESTRITSGFGYRNVPRPCYCHSGLDIASGGEGGGDKVYAAYSGTVKSVYNGCSLSPNCFKEPLDVNCGCNGGLGNMITIEHESPAGTKFWTHYYHLGEIFINQRDTVTSGQNIAETSNTGRSSGPHLHFEVAVDDSLRDSSAVSPCSLFSDVPMNCQQTETKSCDTIAGKNAFEIDIPLPGAGEKIKGKVVVKKW